MYIQSTRLSTITWYPGLDECNEICYKDPVLKDQKWSAYIDRSPGSASYSEVFILLNCDLSPTGNNLCCHKKEKKASA